MIAGMSKRNQRYAALALLGLAILIVLSLTVLPIYVANSSRQDTLDQAQDRLQRYRQVAIRDQELLPKYQEIRKRQKAAGNHLRSDTVAVAGAEMQRMVKQVTSRNQSQLISTQILPSASEDGFVRVAIRVRLKASLPALLRLMYELETHEVHMFLDELSVRTTRILKPTPQGFMPPVEAEFDLFAYMPEESS
jgi:hypothetical protein